jgi:hypothetical protein
MPRREPLGKHWIHADLIGKAIHLTDTRTGATVEATFAGSSDNRTVYAYTDEGFIGGWTCSRKRGQWRQLADSINHGNLYARMDDLPRVPGC